MPVGAVLIKHGEVVARAHNRVEQTGDATAHAELLCLREAMERLGPRLTDCTLYITLEPCAMCAGACVNAKLSRLVYGAFDEAAGCCGSKMDLTDHCFLYSVETWGGILEPDCKALLTNFFQALR
ncbi:tRNA-specific adenosine deaminase [bioreactor metagenome]|uniref:tRNA-specific adenosine deaminase n=1 Tax=bioreactor metagenome TaxID=1076179 RepID=A0A645FZX7_9ZZZZ